MTEPQSTTVGKLVDEILLIAHEEGINADGDVFTTRLKQRSAFRERVCQLLLAAKIEGGSSDGTTTAV